MSVSLMAMRTDDRRKGEEKEKTRLEPLPYLPLADAVPRERDDKLGEILVLDFSALEQQIECPLEEVLLLGRTQRDDGRLLMRRRGRLPVHVKDLLILLDAAETD